MIMKRRRRTKRHVLISDLPIGTFADMNGFTIYRYQSKDCVSLRETWMPGVWIIEARLDRSIFHAPYVIDADGQWEYMAIPCGKPAKKHVDQAINLLGRAAENGKINSLTYLDNYVTLKGYLKPYSAKKKADKADA
jgi:hypothetical protein